MTDIIAIVDTSNQVSATVTDTSINLAQSNLSNPAIIQSMSDIGNVDSTTLNNGSVLVYKTITNKWTSTTTLDAQNMEGGEF